MGGRKKRVLILEDLDSTRKTLVSIVKECGDRLIIYDFPDLPSAFQCAMNTHIDLFLLDIVLQPQVPNDFSGIQFAESIREYGRYASAEIVFITSLAGLEAELLRTTHCFDYIEKPISKRRVQKTVREVLRKLDGRKKDDELMLFRKEGVTYPVWTDQIIYVESHQKVLYVYTMHEMIDVYNLSLKKFLEQVQTQNFLCPARGTAINLKYVEYVNPRKRIVKMKENGAVINIGGGSKVRFMKEIRLYENVNVRKK